MSKFDLYVHKCVMRIPWANLQCRVTSNIFGVELIIVFLDTVGLIRKKENFYIRKQNNSAFE